MPGRLEDLAKRVLLVLLLGMLISASVEVELINAALFQPRWSQMVECLVLAACMLGTLVLLWITFGLLKGMLVYSGLGYLFFAVMVACVFSGIPSVPGYWWQHIGIEFFDVRPFHPLPDAPAATRHQVSP